MRILITSVLFIITVLFNYLTARATEPTGFLTSYTPVNAWIPSVASLLILGGYLGYTFYREKLGWFFIAYPGVHYMLVILATIVDVFKLIAFFILFITPINYAFEVLAAGYLLGASLKKGFSQGRVIGILINTAAFIYIMVNIVMNTNPGTLF